jgi:hypothetical protein
MKLLQNKPNVDTSNLDYPQGKMIDETGLDDGSRANEEFMNDYVQLLEKLFALSGMSANGSPDNDANGYQLVEALFNLLPKKFVYETTTILDNDIKTILRSDIEVARNTWGSSDLEPFGTGLMVDVTLPKSNVDFQIQAWVENTSDDWRLLNGAAGSPGNVYYQINDTTGDITATLEGAPYGAPVNVRFVLLG